jgi:hypothetical protein
MFFVASKLFWLVADPVNFLLLAGVSGVLLGFTRFARAGRLLRAGAISLLAIGLLTPIGALLLRPLEDRFPQPPENLAEPAGIIVLGGAVDTPRSRAREQVYLNSDAARMTKAVELARRSLPRVWFLPVDWVPCWAKGKQRQRAREISFCHWACRQRR